MENSVSLTEMTMIARLGISFVAGAVIGFERSSRRQVAGLRTHILICLGATLLMLLSIWLPRKFSLPDRGDPGRIAAQVVSGIGFLGAGAMIRLGNNVKGLTTAASLWLVAAVGLAVGAGMYVAAAATEILTLVTLILLSMLEKRLFPSERNKLLELYYKHDSSPDTGAALKIINGFGIRSQSMDVNQETGKGKGSRLRFLVSIPVSTDISKLAKALKTAGKVARVEIKEKY
ncbi:MAG: MgtC/SapB family protein [Treponema sp.]|jgi:putative Mg2+ transporter-C (MgtC) family protein|nr:MgtC/SapB family protein [Treponema sp.]